MKKNSLNTREFWTVTEVVEFFQIDETFLSELEEEDIVCPICKERPATKLFPPSELEKLRLVKVLYEDMGVNLPGIEVILRMRQSMFDMRHQFDAILEDLMQNLREAFKKGL
jgi:MerR family transcriptional regulator/heat shock protein HspR